MPVEQKGVEGWPAGRAAFGEEGGAPRLFKASASRSILQEDRNGPMLPPAGASRAETVFATVGIALLLILALSFLWTLLRQRRR